MGWVDGTKPDVICTQPCGTTDKIVPPLQRFQQFAMFAVDRPLVPKYTRAKLDSSYSSNCSVGSVGSRGSFTNSRCNSAALESRDSGAATPSTDMSRVTTASSRVMTGKLKESFLPYINSHINYSYEFWNRLAYAFAIYAKNSNK